MPEKPMCEMRFLGNISNLDMTTNERYHEFGRKKTARPLISMIRNLTYGAMTAILAFNLHAEESEAAPNAVPMDAEAVRENASYALGYRTGMSFSQEYAQFGLTPVDLNSETFAKAFFKAMSAEQPDADPEAMQAAMQALGSQLQEREEKIAEENRTAGIKFLEENSTREGVITTESGLQYEILEKGGNETYTEPEDEDAPQKQFVVHYKGSTIDGSEFDASAEGEPVTMTLRVIDGFREALTTMPVGSKWKLFIPSESAYGERRQSAKIGPNSTLIFELELVSIEDAPPAQQGFPIPMPGN